MRIVSEFLQVVNVLGNLICSCSKLTVKASKSSVSIHLVKRLIQILKQFSYNQVCHTTNMHSDHSS